MIFKGRYSQTNWDNPLAPFVNASLRTVNEQWIEVSFLIDLGADGTYLPSQYAKKLGMQLDRAPTEDNVTGVGGQRAEYVPFTTQLRFSNGDEKILELEIGIFTQADALDVPILGRDVMNCFTVLCDFRGNLVWLLDETERTQLLQCCEAMETP